MIGRVRERQPRAAIVALIDSTDAMHDAFSSGAVSVTLLSDLAICCSNLLRTRRGDAAVDVSARADFGRLRRVMGDLRSGLLSATVSLNLMTIVADSVERAILFVLRREALVALGAFGTLGDGTPLAGITHGLCLHIEPETALERCISDGNAWTIVHDHGELPEELAQIIDRPSSGEGVFFPVLGARRAIGLIYADNGRQLSSIKDVELMELATAQMGLAFENELLRRQLMRIERVAV
jgi:hypothetical protein